jgi:hypothetical protein
MVKNMKSYIDFCRDGVSSGGSIEEGSKRSEIVITE